MVVDVALELLQFDLEVMQLRLVLALVDRGVVRRLLLHLDDARGGCWILGSAHVVLLLAMSPQAYEPLRHRTAGSAGNSSATRSANGNGDMVSHAEGPSVQLSVQCGDDHVRNEVVDDNAAAPLSRCVGTANPRRSVGWGWWNLS